MVVECLAATNAGCRDEAEKVEESTTSNNTSSNASIPRANDVSLLKNKHADSCDDERFTECWPDSNNPAVYDNANRVISRKSLSKRNVVVAILNPEENVVSSRKKTSFDTLSARSLS
jgi:hypothetical protein